MSRLTPEERARRAHNTERQQAWNVNLGIRGGLSQEQICLLTELGTFRHWLHCNKSSASFRESAEFEKISVECSAYSDCEEQGIRERVAALFGLAPFSRIDWTDDSTLELDESWHPPAKHGAERRAYLASFLEQVAETNVRKFDRINTQIEDFLTTIDDQYGTGFCPTGKTRSF